MRVCAVVVVPWPCPWWWPSSSGWKCGCCGRPTLSSKPGSAMRYTHESQFIRRSPLTASSYRSHTRSSSSGSGPMTSAERTSTSGCAAAQPSVCCRTRSGRMPVNRKYGRTTIRRAPSRTHRSSPLGTSGAASDTNAVSTPAYPRPSHSSRAALCTSALASGSVEPRPTSSTVTSARSPGVRPEPPPSASSSRRSSTLSSAGCGPSGRPYVYEMPGCRSFSRASAAGMSPLACPADTSISGTAAKRRTPRSTSSVTASPSGGGDSSMKPPATGSSGCRAPSSRTKSRNASAPASSRVPWPAMSRAGGVVTVSPWRKWGGTAGR